MTKPRVTPCATCPYRLDAPSGLWHEDEYAKLPLYDGEMTDQIRHGAVQPFACHTDVDCYCAGWVACHGSENLLALRVDHRVEPETWSYETDVKLHESGAEACAHGMRDIDDPGPGTAAAAIKLMRLRDDLGR